MIARPERERSFDGYIYIHIGLKAKGERNRQGRGQESRQHLRRGAYRAGLETAGRPEQHQRKFVVGLAHVTPRLFSVLQARLWQQDRGEINTNNI